MDTHATMIQMTQLDKVGPQGDQDQSQGPILAVRGLTKSYGPVIALAGVDVDLYRGEVVALLGDNGAGKSTFISILAGVNQPTSGELYLDGRPIKVSDPLQARELGIVTVFQDLALVEPRDIAANLFLGLEPRRFGFLLDRPRMYREAENVLRDLRVNVPSVRMQVRRLSGGQRQAVAVARTIARGCRIVIMDEPTAALGVREAGKVLDLVRQLKASGHTVLLVSHNLASVFEVADRAVVLRLGRKVAERRLAETTMEEIVGFVVGSIEEDK
jgi:ABC-type sugar transport system ATPase subunit